MKTVKIQKIPYQDTWPIRHKVMWPNQPFDFVQLPEDKNGIHYGLFLDDQLTSIVSVYITGFTAQFRKFATLENEQGKGYGSQLLSFLLEKLEEKQITLIWCNARKDKITYYQKFGFVTTEKTYVKAGVDFVVMEKLVNTLED